MKEFLQNYEKYIDIATNLIFVFLSIMLFFRTKDTKYLIGVLEKMNETKTKTKGQVFSNLVPVYRLNKQTNVLEKTDDFIDIQELVNSSLETSLDRALERLLPIPNDIDTIQESVDIMEDKLDTVSHLINVANDYRLKNNLSNDMSIEDIYKQMKVDSEKLKETLNSAVEKQKIKETIKNDTIKNDTIVNSDLTELQKENEILKKELQNYEKV